ncbi:succinylglutamate desuccinylase/aspartoacylase family protein [Photobacterium rosenbergii]|uniref:Succinylglutamate desuccinylase/aspartoacylase family protein n=1 Tax=Photobacterium rosenbergii TaxID=294936 RepID=A0ABU3ZGQ2_9GAMM|nr:succinylglutamate desuccinylase/aspartoacylase family protein [Photobacterium rosenbergii]MDV5169297.1 succinylglutamate desuccinylase/aspartoacylase family protein [Photobacterium rosenbergii]
MAKAKKNTPFQCGDATVMPGERMSVDLEVARLYTHSNLSVTLEIVNGRLSGPVLLVDAAIHGDELNGVEIVRQLLTKIDPQRLRGTLVAVPVVNVFGFIHKSRYLPDRRDLNRSFPGSARGSIAGRIAYQFFNSVVMKCTHVIDLHTAAIHRTNLPQIRANLSHQASSEMAEAFGTPVIIDAALRDGSLRAEAEKTNIPIITYEAGEALRFEPFAINAGLRGIQRVMRYLGMLPQGKILKGKPPVVARATRWIRADFDGILRSHVTLGQRVDKNQILAIISDPLGSDEVAIKAVQGGIIIGQQTLPLVNEGDAIYHIAYFDEPDHLVEEKVELYLDNVMEENESEINTGIGKNK